MFINKLLFLKLFSAVMFFLLVPSIELFSFIIAFSLVVILVLMFVLPVHACTVCNIVFSIKLIIKK